MPIAIRTVSGAALTEYLDDLARLRIAVFAAFPYLYDGDQAAETDYLREFAREPGSVLVTASDNGRLVGAATASPMTSQKPEIRAPLEELGYQTGAIFYFGESVLLPEYRGQGIGHAFFNHREAAARDAGAGHAAFAAVMREADDPRRPADYRPLDAFWRRRGYKPVPHAQMALAWKEHGQAAETTKHLQYWMGLLRPLVAPMN